ncbi:MAG: cell wall-binding repeat-containing protein, partial [Coriobacteriia bacterium]
IGRRPDGTCIAVGTVAAAVATWTNVIDVAVGEAHAVGLRADGTVVATGSNSSHQCDVSSWTDIVQVAAGYDHTVGLRSDGTVVAVGSTVGRDTDTYLLENWLIGWGIPIVRIDASGHHTMAVRADGESVIIGDSMHGYDFTGVATKRPATAWIGGSGEAVGLRFDSGFAAGAEWSSLTASIPTLADGQSVKFAVRTSEDGITYSEPLGYDGRPINWTDRTGNYLGRGESDSAPRTSLEAVPDARYLDIVVRLETPDAMISPWLKDVTVSCREADCDAPTVASDAVASYGDSATVTVTANDNFGLASISYRLDGEATVTVSASGTAATKAVTTGTLGEHAIEFWATDLSGNVSAHGSAGFTVLDASAPTVASDAVASYEETATLAITAEDNFELASISYRLDGEATVTVTATDFSAETSLTTSALGEHTLAFWATDAAGNVCAPTSATFVVLDAVAPTADSDAGGNYDDVALLAIRAADNRGLASISYRLNGEATVTVPVSGLSAAAPVSVTRLGENTLEYWATDGGGNESAHGTAAFTILDATAPTVTSDALDTYRDTAAILISASDDRGLASISYRVNGESTVTVEAAGTTAAVPVNIAALGEYSLEFWATDASGNEGMHGSAMFDVLDGTPPVVTIDAVSTYEDLAVLMISATDETDLGSISYSLDGAPPVTRPKTGTLGLLVAWTQVLGDHTLEYWATDAAGNESMRSSATFLVEPAVMPMDPPPQGLSRLYGEDRYGTAVRASMEMFPGGAGVVVIASGEDWPDALGGSALAGVVDGPLLLTRSQGLPEEVRDEIVRLGATKVYILGGTGAVSTIAEAELRGLLGAANVRRLGGADRYETARLIAAEVIWLQGAGYDGTVLVASGGTFADALAASPLAAGNGWPILLARPQGDNVELPAPVTDVVVLGGTGAVSERTRVDLESTLDAGRVTRVGGLDRYDTAALIAAYGAGHGASWACVGIATGSDFPDGLAAGAAIGARDGLLLLTPPDALHAGARAALTANAGTVKTVYVIGGVGAVSADVEVAAREALGLE